MRRDSDPWKKMGVDPNTPGRSLKHERHKSNPKVSSDSSYHDCKACGKLVSPLEIVDKKYCPSCAEKIIKCSVCGNEFIPEKNYYHRCPACEKNTPKKCRKCGKEFIPKKSYYHTCPDCI